MDKTKIQLDGLLVKYKAEPVGRGYIDCIIMNDDLVEFVDEITALGIKIIGFTVWCHCTDEHKEQYNCPHGLGGPESTYHDGWFSEMYFDDSYFEVENNERVVDMIFNRLPMKSWYSPCIMPALWLDVPDSWRNKQQGTK